MLTLKPSEAKSIEQFFQLKEENLLKVMYKFLSTKYKTVYCTKDYILAVGDIPVALVGHMDTVFATPPDNIFYDRIKNVMWSPDGLGADDRAGVYSIVQIVKQGLKPTVILTTGEEKGAIGASALIKAFPEPPTELKYIIELDRRGSVDCVFYECANPEFEEYVEDFGFVTAWGTFTDISVICPKWKIAGVNLSIGYEDEHSYIETLYIGHMLATIKKVIKMLNAAINLDKTFEYIPMPYDSYLAYANAYNSWYYPKDTKQCIGCGIDDQDYNLFPVKSLENNTVFLCADCFAIESDNIGWCKHCNEPFIINPKSQIKDYCYDCQEKGDLTPCEILYTKN